MRGKQTETSQKCIDPYKHAAKLMSAAKVIYVERERDIHTSK